MFEGQKAAIKMKRALVLGTEQDERKYVCRVLEYEEEEERIYLVLEDGKLEDISLEAVYTCLISGEACGCQCDGIIRERYCQEAGKTVVFEIKNGFYKINLNSVDKKEA